VTWVVAVRPRAEADLVVARDWYEQRRPGLGREFLAAVDDVLVGLQSNPYRCAVYYREFRRALTRRFPYKVFYRIEPDAVVVVRVLHVRRDHTRQLADRSPA
jgi:plasmid stabilization system protein ParE